MKVSVCMVTYNQEKYIAQAIESVLMQQVNFEYEIVIGEDCSTDRTRAIVEDYAARYPGKITALLHPQNLGPAHIPGKNNFVATLKACQGQYIALLEGDDYWTDPYKLQKQVDFMESRPDCAICCHPVQMIYSDERVQHWGSIYGKNEKESYTIEEMLSGPPPQIPTPGMMLRWELLPKLPEWFGKVLRGDGALHLLFAQYGKVCFLSECMAAHRKHGGGVSRLFDTDPDLMAEDKTRLYIYFDRHSGYKYHLLLRDRIADGLYRAALAHLRKEQRTRALQALVRYWFCDSSGVAQRVRKTLSGLFPLKA